MNRTAPTTRAEFAALQSWRDSIHCDSECRWPMYLAEAIDPLLDGLFAKLEELAAERDEYLKAASELSERCAELEQGEAA